MNKTILFLIVALVISTTIGSATAILVPISLETPTTVQLYTVSSTFAGTNQFADLNCEPGDTVVSGYFILPDPVELNTHKIWAVDNDNGMTFEYSLDSGLFDITIQLVCAKVVSINCLSSSVSLLKSPLLSETNTSSDSGTLFH